ncbi:hypothetical protein CXG81DRAFT_13935 [Caulochytrium protostelioides]|uniref:Peptidyl-tRNA hydrolase n=1 Tax=Caulochytrium protostelioides TaxID=1555241 RepID=A0A4P9X496_9FUNG|nr:hypothetical protein CXG81DRAFT_13935 [Caulochytrium protostelioides]|eukprot:RKO99851.1 hypothetical protein CXG81DRAFT_13935 [Caulochytrium protostelioides]
MNAPAVLASFLEKPVDLLVVGLGNAHPELMISRHNAGFIFADYLANCVAMQRHMARADMPSPEKQSAEFMASLSQGYEMPTYYRHLELMSDLHVTDFALFDDNMDIKDIIDASGKRLAPKVPVRRLAILKPLTGMNNAGHAVKRALQVLQIKDPAKQLIVVLDDVSVLPGTIQIAAPGDVRGATGHNGLTSLINVLGTSQFTRLRMGIGRPDRGQSVEQYSLSPFGAKNREMVFFGHALDQTAQALQFFARRGDIKLTKKRFGTTKLPRKLREMNGLVFPFQLVGPPEAFSAPSEKQQQQPQQQQQQQQQAVTDGAAAAGEARVEEVKEPVAV